MKPLITVIIPAYNAYETIKAAIQSVFNTNYDNLEILVSDDGSEKSYQYLFLFYPKIKIIHSKRNFGAGVARQKALDKATGDFVCFLDADDLLKPCIFDKINEEMLHSYDIINYNVYHKKFNENDSCVYDSHTQSITHGKIFRRKFLVENNIRFDPNFRYYEDTYFTMTCFLHTKKILYVDEIGYTLIDNFKSTTKQIPDFLNTTIYENVDVQCTLIERYYGSLITKKDAFAKYNEYFKWLIEEHNEDIDAIYRIFDSLQYFFNIEFMDKETLKKMFKERFSCDLDIVLEYYEKWRNTLNQKILSIIIPLYNSHRYIVKTLDSLYKILGDDIDKVEVILTDDNSKDPYYSYLLKHYRNLRIISNRETVRMGMNRNRGLFRAKGKWITFLDHDDKFYPIAIKDILSQKYDKDGINIIRGKNRNLCGIESKETHDYYCIELLHGVFYRRTFLRKHEIYFSNVLHTSEDSYFNRRAFTISKMEYGENSILDVDEVYYYWNFHKDSTMQKLYNGRKYEEEFYQEYVKAVLLGYDIPNIDSQLKLANYIFLINHAEFNFSIWETNSKNYRKNNLKVLCALLLLLEKEYGVTKETFHSWIESNTSVYLEYFKEDFTYMNFGSSFKYSEKCYEILEKTNDTQKKKMLDLLS